ncbi:hypothetical protein RQP46_006025 [Phenoliferia psychrophenolica]
MSTRNGLSGIYLGVKLPAATQNIDFTIYEKNAGVGGTWFENTYPVQRLIILIPASRTDNVMLLQGCACDIPANRYCYTFEPNPNWSTFYAPAPELQKYFESVATKYNVDSYIKLDHAVVSALWNEESGTWKLKVKNGDRIFDDECHILVSGMGVLNNWKWPDISGLHSFKGDLVHSAVWDHSVDFVDKKVAVIGSGSSGIQIIPNILPKTAHLGAYLRSPTWITPPASLHLLDTDANGDYIFEYSDAQRKEFTDNPASLLRHRRDLEMGVSAAFRVFMKGSEDQKDRKIEVAESMRQRLAAKPELAEQMIPNWDLGCRRLTPGIGYLEALCDDKVECIMEGIESIDATGITSVSGVHRDYDVVVCATGFDVSFGSRFPFVGRNGRELDKKFAESPEGYMAMTFAGFPNFFQFNGPNAPVGMGSLVPATEAQGDYIVKAINKIQRQSIKSMVIKDECVRDFVAHSDRFHEGTVWSAGCRSWYKNGKVDGRVTALWPGSGLHFIDSLEDPRWEDYEYTQMDKNRYEYLGNGFTQLEVDGGDRTTNLGRLTDRFLDHPALQPSKAKEVAAESSPDEKLFTL